MPAWISFFQSHNALEGLLLYQSPRFDLECMSALAMHCPNVTKLRLKEIGKLDDTFLPHISSFRHLEQLDLSSTSGSCSEDGLLGVLLLASKGAAGVAGLIKTALALHHGAIPPSLHLRNPNPAIPWQDYALEISSELRPWPKKGVVV